VLENCKLVPVGRFGTVDETDGAALMLVRIGYVTGQTLNVNSGVYMTS
jgi:NAD(P)-dependent dehydrogenase (short-subunit alcohol dehydrogenase family)